MKKTLLIAAIALFSMSSVSMLSAAEAITATHVKGVSTIPAQAKKLVVMDYGILDTLSQLGVDAEIALPKAALPAYLNQFRSEKYPDLGALKKFDIEAIKAFKPELIIISTRQNDFYDDLSAIAPVYVVNRSSDDQLGEGIKDIALVGKIFDKEADAQAAITKLQEAAARCKAQATEGGKTAILVLHNAGVFNMYGGKSRFGMPHDSLGVAQAEPKANADKIAITVEEMAALNPDIIYVIDRCVAVGDTDKATTIINSPVLAETKAAKNKCIILLDPDLWYMAGSGIQSLTKMIGEIEKASKPTNY